MAAAAKDHGPQIKRDDVYERVRGQGASKRKAARIANAQASDRREPARKGGRSPSYEDWSKDELYGRARELEVDGRSRMSKAELIAALRGG